MASTYEKIATSTLGSAVASTTFSSISGAYTDLIVIANVQGQSNGCNMQIWFNGDGSGTSYSNTRLYLSSSSVISSVRDTNQAKLNTGTNGGMPFANANQFGLNIYHIQNYSNATTYKSVIVANRSPSGGYTGAMEVVQGVGIWRNTAAITSVTIGVDNSKTMQIGSSFTIYGIKAA
jgi:hypothetical protein